MKKKIALKKTTLRKLTNTTLENVHGGARAVKDVDATGQECGGVYYCDSNATCGGTACNYTIR